MQARANLTKARSELDRARVQLTDAQQKFTRAQELSSSSCWPRASSTRRKIAVDTAKAAVASQQATVTQVQAAVTQSEASVNQSQVNRDHTVIVAPIDGIVTQRNVDVGQTVAASMQAPTLFIIAADLTEMQVNANIDEADVGRIRPGQQVSFRVDAYPTDNFIGTVTQVRLQPVVVQNVTTYGDRDHGARIAELKLKPGMTANVKIEIAQAHQRAAHPECRAAIPSDRRRSSPRSIRRRRPRQRHSAAVAAAADVAAVGRGGAAPARATAIARLHRTGAALRSDRGERHASRASRSPTPSATDGRHPAEAAVAAAAAADLAAAVGGGWRRRWWRIRRPAAAARGGPEFQARMLERFKTMSPDEQQQFIARMKERGGDTSAFEARARRAKRRRSAARRGAAHRRTTIDALFAPLPLVESRGRAWLFIDKQLKPVHLRLGISDGTYTEADLAASCRRPRKSSPA